MNNNKKLFVGSLPWSVNDQKLQELFAPYGTVVSARVIMHRDTGKSRGFGFVEMSTEEEAQKALEAMNGSQVDGRALVVSIAKPAEERPGNGGGGYNRGR